MEAVSQGAKLRIIAGQLTRYVAWDAGYAGLVIATPPWEKTHSQFCECPPRVRTSTRGLDDKQMKKLLFPGDVQKGNALKRLLFRPILSGGFLTRFNHMSVINQAVTGTSGGIP